MMVHEYESLFVRCVVNRRRRYLIIFRTHWMRNTPLRLPFRVWWRIIVTEEKKNGAIRLVSLSRRIYVSFIEIRILDFAYSYTRFVSGSWVFGCRFDNVSHFRVVSRPKPKTHNYEIQIIIFSLPHRPEATDFRHFFFVALCFLILESHSKCSWFGLSPSSQMCSQLMQKICLCLLFMVLLIRSFGSLLLCSSPSTSGILSFTRSFRTDLYFRGRNIFHNFHGRERERETHTRGKATTVSDTK